MTRLETYIRNNYRTQSMKGIARDLKIPYDRVRKIMIANGWQSTHNRCTTIFQPVTTKANLFDWGEFSRHDLMFQTDTRDYNFQRYLPTVKLPIAK